jgi:acyl carrier protein
MTDDRTYATLVRLIDEARIATDQEPLGQVPGDDLFLPEVLDSLALATLIALIEDQWDIEFSDDEIEPQVFESLGELNRFVKQKILLARSG